MSTGAVANPFEDDSLTNHPSVEAKPADGNPFNDPALARSDTTPTPTKNFDVGAALGGMHGGSYDIAFRDPKGQISPDTIKAEAVGGSAGVGADLAAPFVGAALAHLNSLDKIVKAAKAMGYGTFSLKEAHDLYKMVAGDGKK